MGRWNLEPMAVTRPRRFIVTVSPNKMWADVLATAAERVNTRAEWRSREHLVDFLVEEDPDGVVIVGDATHQQTLASVARSLSRLPIGVLHLSESCTCISRHTRVHDISPLHMSGLEELAHSIDKLFRGSLLALSRDKRSLAAVNQSSAHEIPHLTPTQYEVVYLVSQGYSNGQIAVQRGTSVRAVEALLSRIFARVAPNMRSRGNARVAITRAFMEQAS